MIDTASYACPAGYDLHVDLDANTQWCGSPTNVNDVVPAQLKAQPMGILGVSSLVAAGLILAAVAISATRTKPKRRRR